MVTTLLQTKFGDQIFGRKAHVPRAAQRPELNILDFWFRGMVMAKVNNENLRTIVELKISEEHVVHAITSAEVLRSTQNIVK